MYREAGTYPVIRALEISLAISLVLGIFVGLPLLALSGLYSLKFGNCLRFPNGTEIGYEAYIDFSYKYFTPEPVVREPDGTIIAMDVDPIHITEKATFGVARPPFRSELSSQTGGRALFSFIWTQETGVVRSDENPDLYQKLKSHLGKIYYGVPKDKNTNTLWVLEYMKNREQFDSDTCHTALMTW